MHRPCIVLVVLSWTPESDLFIAPLVVSFQSPINRQSVFSTCWIHKLAMSETCFISASPFQNLQSTLLDFNQWCFNQCFRSIKSKKRRSLSTLAPCFVDKLLIVSLAVIHFCGSSCQWIPVFWGGKLLVRLLTCPHYFFSVFVLAPTVPASAFWWLLTTSLHCFVSSLVHFSKSWTSAINCLFGLFVSSSCQLWTHELGLCLISAALLCGQVSSTSICSSNSFSATCVFLSLVDKHMLQEFLLGCSFCWFVCVVRIFVQSLLLIMSTHHLHEIAFSWLLGLRWYLVQNRQVVLTCFKIVIITIVAPVSHLN